MIITIDTEKDAPEQLRKAADFLLSLSGSSQSIVRERAPETVEIDEGIFDIFQNAQTEDAPARPDDDEDAPARVFPY